jgi:hypothetical protein
MMMELKLLEHRIVDENGFVRYFPVYSASEVNTIFQQLRELADKLRDSPFPYEAVVGDRILIIIEGSKKV